MFRSLRSIGVGLVLSATAVACSREAGLTSPTNASTTTANSDSLQSKTSSHDEALTAVIGRGAGVVNVSPTAKDKVGFSAEINVNVDGAPPDTTFFVQRAPEVGRANGADGICQRALGLPPWGPPTPNFVTFQLPNSGPPLTLATDAGGSGSAHLSFDLPTVLNGVQFDVMFQLVDNLTAPTNELRTGCFTVTVK